MFEGHLRGVSPYSPERALDLYELPKDIIANVPHPKFKYINNRGAVAKEKAETNEETIWYTRDSYLKLLVTGYVSPGGFIFEITPEKAAKRAEQWQQRWTELVDRYPLLMYWLIDRPDLDKLTSQAHRCKTILTDKLRRAYDTGELKRLVKVRRNAERRYARRLNTWVDAAIEHVKEGA